VNPVLKFLYYVSYRKVGDDNVKGILIAAVLVFSLLFSSGSIFAKEYGKVGVISSKTGSDSNTESEIPPGMEMKKVGSTSLLVPKGAKLYKRGAATFVEGASAYSARKFETMESRLDKIEKSIKELKEEIKTLQ